MNSQFNKRIRNILVKNGLLEQEEADSALIESGGDESITTVLFEKKVIDEPTLIATISKESHLPPVDLDKIEFDDKALGTLSQDMAAYYRAIPIAKIGALLTIAVANPFDILKMDDLRTLTECELRPIVTTDDAIDRVITKAYNPGEEQMSNFMDSLDDDAGGELELNEQTDDDEDDFDLSNVSGSGDSPVIKLVNMLIYQGIQEGASDIHIEPFEKIIRVRYRCDGVLKEAMTPPKKLSNAMASRIKIMCGLDIAERRVPQDGKFQMKVEGRQVDFRVSVLPIVHGEKIVMRILDSSSLNRTLESLGWEPSALETFMKGIDASYGMLLVTGPTGSGKSTTLYSAIREVISVEENITTVEDPVEYQLQGVCQVPVNAKRGLTFGAALRSILRQDPDTVMIGEIRDLETADIAVKAALTGHLVFSTLHTNDAPSTITRMIDMGVDPFMVASSLLVCTAQRLLRRICDHCKTPAEGVARERLLQLGCTEEDLANEESQIVQAVGCSRCSNGYKGRFVVVEALEVTEEVRKIIIQGGSAIDIRDKALENGMLTLRRVAMLNALRGKTSIEEVLRVTMDD